MLEVKWVQRRRSRNLGEPVIWLNVALADAAWRKDAGYYVSPDTPLGGKLGRFDTWMRSGPRVVEMAEVWLTLEGVLTFTNGRHRFAWMRGNGALALPVCTDPEDEAAREQL